MQLPVLQEITERKIVGSRLSAIGNQPVTETIKPQIPFDFGVETDTKNIVQKDVVLDTQNVNKENIFIVSKKIHKSHRKI